MKQKWGLNINNVLRPTPGDPWGVEQHHWNSGAEENQQQKSSSPNQLKKQTLFNDQFDTLELKYFF